MEVDEMTPTTVTDTFVELDRPFAEFFRTLSGPWPFRPLLALAPGKHFMPAADVFTRNGDLIVSIDLPGIEPKDIHVKFHEGGLTVTGERKAAKDLKETGFYRKEAGYGFFERHMTLPKGIKEADVEAQYVNGVLEISIPHAVKPNGKPEKEIPVKAAVNGYKTVAAIKTAKPIKA
jgi:HSP20 family molecular chaperone IbpA